MFSVCACSLRYPAVNAHAPYWYLCPLFLYLILPHRLLKGEILWEKNCWTQNVFWFSLQILSEIFLIPRRIQRDIIINVLRSACKALVFLFTFQSNSNLLDKFSENIQMSYFMIFVQWEPSCSMRTDRQTDMTKLIVTFCNFGNVPKSEKL